MHLFNFIYNVTIFCVNSLHTNCCENSWLRCKLLKTFLPLSIVLITYRIFHSQIKQLLGTKAWPTFTFKVIKLLFLSPNIVFVGW